MMNVLDLFENHMGERRLGFSAEAGSRKPETTEGQTLEHSPQGTIEFS